MDCISLLHITDTHLLASDEGKMLGVDTTRFFNSVLTSAIQTHAHFDLCIATGDLAQEPNTTTYLRLLQGLEQLSLPCYCLPGNHDEWALMQSILQTPSVHCQKQIFLNNWQIICLDSTIPNSPKGRLDLSELAYLENCLVKNPNLFTLIAVHHPAIQCGSLWMDEMMIENAEAFLALANRFPSVKVVINGHIHQAMDVEINGIRLLSSPSTCFQFKPESAVFTLDTLSPGYRKIDLYNDGRIETEVFRIPEKIQNLEIISKGY